MKKKFSVISLGCFRNTYDSQLIITEFVNKGYVYTENLDKLDLLVINTCGFVQSAKEESLDILEKAVDSKRSGQIKKIIVIGCLVQRYQSQLSKFFPEIDQWRGVVAFPAKLKNNDLFSPKWLGFLKIAEGCNNFCSYCAIPLIKGSLRSMPAKDILSVASMFNDRGVKELNIIGQDITSWGYDFSPKLNLCYLLKEILKVTIDIDWIRLLYLHPEHISDELIDLIADNRRICNYIDLPIQHINDRILQSMNRPITRKQIMQLIKKIRRKIPGVALRTSVIVGFPGETEEQFKELLGFIEEIKFERLGAFVYSREEGTKAYKMPGQVHHKTKKRRWRQLMEKQKSISYEYNKSFVNKDIDILVEERENNFYLGRSQFSAYDIDGIVYLESNKQHKEGTFAKVKVKDAYEYDLVAE
jgi:ribosomal protein S12 methylthiotransferase